MNDLLPLPSPRVPITVRLATPDDVPFLDRLQKLHAKQVGWMPTATLLGKVRLGHVRVAEDAGEPVGYVIGQDRYFKRDDVGVVYQLNVLPGRQRGFVGATLLQALFDAAAYGCRLFCCWCAQDIAANRFWEAMGFVPLAFRAGSESKSRVHIFWQKRIRAGDTGDVSCGGTPWWFPSQTTGGSLREDRIVLPIPPGTHWSDAKPLVLPADLLAPKRLGTDVDADAPAPRRVRKAKADVPAAEAIAALPLRGLRFAAPPVPSPASPVKAPRVKKPARKNDPRLVAAARELRDRWLEEVNAGRALPAGAGKYDLARLPPPATDTRRLLPAARAA